MLKVFLVEDEFIVREGIKRNIDWKANGFEFCGEAGDGELAYPLIQKARPDIIITDIRMPFMDGLTLSKMVKEDLPDTEIIILTGHEEFEYAKEGIKIGVAEYLTKPISSEQLLLAIQKVAARIEEKKKDQDLIEQYKKEMEEDTEDGKRQLFASLMSEDFLLPPVLEKAKKLGMDLSAVWYNIVLLKVNSTRHDAKEYSNRVVKTGNRLKELSQAEHFYLFDRYLEGSALLFLGDEEKELLETQQRVLHTITEYLDGYEDIQYFAGVGEPVNRLREIGKSFDQASHAFANRFLINANRVMYYRDATTSGLEQEMDFAIEKVNPKQFDRMKIVEFLRTGDSSEVSYFVEEFVKNLGANVFESKLFRQYIAMDIYFSVTEFVSELHQDKSLVETMDVKTGILTSTEASKRYFERIITQGVNLREQVARDKYGDVVAEVIAYIDDNYQNEDLSLNMIASHVNFSPNHLSMVFSQQTGQTFIKYLTDYRMTKAKELMKCTNKKTNIIALEVGYKDSHYFSYLFKKTQGLTPTQYRSK